jgi:hypothetical protein
MMPIFVTVLSGAIASLRASRHSAYVWGGSFTHRFYDHVSLELIAIEEGPQILKRF